MATKQNKHTKELHKKKINQTNNNKKAQNETTSCKLCHSKKTIFNSLWT